MDWQISQKITFEGAMARTQLLIEQILEDKLKKQEILTAITSLFRTENGARGFFVVYLTSKISFIGKENLFYSIVEAFSSSPELVSDLLVKNLAMSTSMAITHRRNNNEEEAKGSDSVFYKTASLIESIGINTKETTSLIEKLKDLYKSAETGEGNYQVFLQRWGFDEEQRQAIQEAITRVLVSILYPFDLVWCDGNPTSQIRKNIYRYIHYNKYSSALGC